MATKLGIVPTQTTTAPRRRASEIAQPLLSPKSSRWPDRLRCHQESGKPAAEGCPRSPHLSKPAIQAEIVKAVQEQFRPAQLELEGVTDQPDFASLVAKTAELVQQQTINIPRIQMVPIGVVKSGFKPFDLKLETLISGPSEELWRQYLRTGERKCCPLGQGGIEEKRLENYVVSGLVDFDDISYDDHADLLYDLATQTVKHFEGYLSEGDTAKVLRCHQREIARFIHAQMQEHFWEESGRL